MAQNLSDRITQRHGILDAADRAELLDIVLCRLVSIHVTDETLAHDDRTEWAEIGFRLLAGAVVQEADEIITTTGSNHD